MSKTIEIRSLDDLPKAARDFLLLLGDHKVIAFYGEMGAGKTTFIKALCAEMGIKDKPASPTFSLVNEYRSPSGAIVYHFDFYRIKEEAEAYDLGYEDYFYSGALCLVEWPEKIEALLPEGTLKVRIGREGESRRLIL